MTTFTQSAILTKVIANPAHREVRQDLRDIQRMHHTLTTLACRPDFGPSSRLAAGLLYRVETTAAGVHILMQSTTQPDRDRLAPGYDIVGSRDLTPLLDQLHRSVRVRYRIVANPTKSLHRGSDKRGQLQPLTGDAAIEWWERKAGESGFELDNIEIVDSLQLTGKRVRPNQPSRLVITATVFDGIATVTDSAAVHDSILVGIGRGKAYGCGLLSVALLRS